MVSVILWTQFELWPNSAMLACAQFCGYWHWCCRSLLLSLSSATRLNGYSGNLRERATGVATQKVTPMCFHGLTPNCGEIVIAQNKHGFSALAQRIYCFCCIQKDPQHIHFILCICQMRFESVALLLRHEQYNDRNTYNARIKLSEYQFDIRYFLLIPFASLLFFVINHSIIQLP